MKPLCCACRGCHPRGALAVFIMLPGVVTISQCRWLPSTERGRVMSWLRLMLSPRRSCDDVIGPLVFRLALCVSSAQYQRRISDCLS